jgi:hypothetical protein
MFTFLACTVSKNICCPALREVETKMKLGNRMHVGGSAGVLVYEMKA